MPHVRNNDAAGTTPDVMSRRVYFGPSRTTMGVGPALVAASLAFIVVVAAVDSLQPGLHITSLHQVPVRALSATALVLALLLYVRTITLVRKASAAHVLLTEGPFRYVRHPIYATYILLVCPAVTLALASWPALAIPFVAYGLYRLLIPLEEARLESAFGERYRDYRRRVPGLVPRPRRARSGQPDAAKR